jgi:hypothetical protein
VRQYPQFQLSPGYYWDHGIAKFPFDVGFTLPLFNRSEGEIAEARAAREVAGQRMLAVGEIIGASRLRSALKGCPRPTSPRPSAGSMPRAPAARERRACALAALRAGYCRGTLVLRSQLEVRRCAQCEPRETR